MRLRISGFGFRGAGRGFGWGVTECGEAQVQVDSRHDSAEVVRAWEDLGFVYTYMAKGQAGKAEAAADSYGCAEREAAQAERPLLALHASFKRCAVVASWSCPRRTR